MVANLNLGPDIVDMTWSRTTFFGTASASATAAGVDVQKYRKVTYFSHWSGPADVAQQNSVTWTPEVSLDAGANWETIQAVDGTAIGSVTHTTIYDGNPIKLAYVFSVVAPLFRIRISSAGNATGCSAASQKLSLLP